MWVNEESHALYLKIGTDKKKEALDDDLHTSLFMLQIESVIGLRCRQRNPYPRVTDNAGNEVYRVSGIIL